MESAAGDGGDYGDFGVGREGSGEAAGVADVFVADEEGDVFADLALFGEDAVANAGGEGVKGRQSVGERGGGGWGGGGGGGRGGVTGAEPGAGRVRGRRT